ncbi:ABC transporter ATP-binding protein [Rhodoligotrophos defluvii]|uniref:ABC transporter ATP-binding protein n=1 Tax=Rhodoligotrophos defluvii TaxID=2561934 RepID=UPI0010C9D19D|nr:ABC transporter ATP-binding protein [Rhodoligotrophos defluvii]
MSEAARAPGPVLVLRDIHRSFRQGSQQLDVLTGTSVTIHAGEIVALVGPSGAGKSTLLHIAGLLEQPDAGTVLIAGRDMGQAGDGERTRVRREAVGFVYQSHRLLPEFSALENVAMPQRLAGAGRRQALARAKELLHPLGLGGRLSHLPAELSGGEQQRVAIARALANRPLLLLADEPTGNLDPRTAQSVHQQLIELVRGQGLAALIATHNLELAAGMDRIVRLDNGRLVEELRD